jgi:hypothetical protein
VDSPEIGPHHPGFEASAGTRSAFTCTLNFAKALAATGLDILRDQKLREKMWAEHMLVFGKKI